MDLISSRYHKPKSRPSKRKQAALDKVRKRWAAVKNVSVLSPTENTVEQSILLPVENENIIPSTSALKLQFYSEESKPNNSSKSDLPTYAFVNKSMWDSLLENVKCSECLSGSLGIKSGNTFGFSNKFELKCKDCDHVFGSTFTSPRAPEKKYFEVNKKIVEAFLRIGKGHAAMEVFSMVLGIQTMDKKTFSKCLNSLSEDGKDVKKEILEIARTVVRKKHEDFDPSLKEQDIINISVSYDGTWHKRGHTSLYGLGIVIDVLTGLVIDFEILSKYCPECTSAARDLEQNSAEYAFWYEGHKPQCQKNHDGSSGSMEMNAAVTLWRRSVSDCKMRYTTLLSDGDSKTFHLLQELQIYGPSVDISKEECINHIAKRLGTGLRNKVKEWRGKGICLGGKKTGSLKESTIVKLTNFYRKAIKDNIPCVENMKTAIYATLFHATSSDTKPKHNKCPEGATSWCFYQRALANNTQPTSHKSMKTQLSEDILAKILPVYQRLASNEILSRCISGKTQNANESVHSLIWKNCPKETFISKKRLELSVTSSISEFNIGCLGTLEMTDKNAVNISLTTARKRDKRRLELSKKRSTHTYKQSRKQNKYSKSVLNQKYSKTEGTTYSSGMF